jgi:hypothetical protein
MAVISPRDAVSAARFDLGRRILVGKIDRRFQVGEETQQPVAQPAIESARPPSSWRSLRRCASVSAARSATTSACQIELAVEKGAAGEFAGSARRRPGCAVPPSPRDYGAAAVQVQLSDVFAGNAGWRKPQRAHHRARRRSRGTQPTCRAMRGSGSSRRAGPGAGPDRRMMAIAAPALRSPGRRSCRGYRSHAHPRQVRAAGIRRRIPLFAGGPEEAHVRLRPGGTLAAG